MRCNCFVASVVIIIMLNLQVHQAVAAACGRPVQKACSTGNRDQPLGSTGHTAAVPEQERIQHLRFL